MLEYRFHIAWWHILWNGVQESTKSSLRLNARKKKHRKERKQGRIHDCSRGSNDLGRGKNDLGRGSDDLGRGMLKYKLSNP